MLPCLAANYQRNRNLDDAELTRQFGLGDTASTVKPSDFQNLSFGEFVISTVLAPKKRIRPARYSGPTITVAIASLLHHVGNVFGLRSLTKMSWIKTRRAITRMQDEQVSIDAAIGKLESKPGNSPHEIFVEHRSVPVRIGSVRPRKALIGIVLLKHLQKLLPSGKFAAPSLVSTHGAILSLLVLKEGSILPC